VAETLAADGGTPVRRDPWPEGDPGPEIGPEDAEAVAEVVRSRRLWRHAGHWVRDLEAAFAALHGLDPAHAVASTSGTSAIHLAVAAVDPDPGDEVVVPPLSDFGTVIPILLQNAVPVFADVLPHAWTLDPEDAARKVGPRTRAIVAVHLFGHPADVRALRQLADAYGIPLIEDAAQAPLADVGGQRVGTFGDFACFSLQQQKHITAGEGGLTLARRRQDAERMRLFADKGWPREGGVRTHLFLGTNYRMTELQGALAAAQLPRLEGIVRRRQERAARLDAQLDGVPGIAPVRPPSPDARSAYWLYPLELDPEVLGVDAATFARLVRAEGIPLASGYVRPLYTVPALAEARAYGRSHFPWATRPAWGSGLCPQAEAMWDRLCYLPWSQGYTDRDVDDVGRAVRKVALALAARAG
jgi:perosamine synthetase